MELIAISGPMYSGKTTLALSLKEQHGYMHINFTDTLKAEVVHALRAVGISTTVERMHQNKKRYRGVTQELGTLLGFDTDPEWVIKALKPWFDAGRPKAVFDNVRTIEQFLTLKPYGFELVELRVTYVAQATRAFALGVTPIELEKALDHPIEAGLQHPELVSLYLNASETPETNIKLLLENPSNQSGLIGRGTDDTQNEMSVPQLPISDTQKRIVVQKAR